MFRSHPRHPLSRTRRITRCLSAGALCFVVSCASQSTGGDEGSTPIDTQPAVTATVDETAASTTEQATSSDPATEQEAEQQEAEQREAEPDGDEQAPDQPDGSTVQDLALAAYLGNDDLHDELVIDEECASELTATMSDEDARRFADLDSPSAEEINTAGLSAAGLDIMAELASCYEIESVIETIVAATADSPIDYDDDCLRSALAEIPDLVELIRIDVLAVFEQVSDCELSIQDLAADNLARSSSDGETVMLDLECARDLAAGISDEDAQALADRDFTDDSDESPLGLSPETVAILEEIERCDDSAPLIQALIDIMVEGSPGADVDVECMRELLEPIDDLQERMRDDSGGLVELLDQCVG